MKLSLTKIITLFITAVCLAPASETASAQAMYQSTARVGTRATITTPPDTAKARTDMTKIGDTSQKIEQPIDPNAAPRRTPAWYAKKLEEARKEAERRAFEAHLDSVIAMSDFSVYSVDFPLLPDYVFQPAIYDHYEFPDSFKIGDSEYSGNEALRWIEEENALARRIAELRYRLFFNSPYSVKRNVAMMPDAPKKFHSVINPEDHTITIEEIASAPVKDATVTPEDYTRRHWVKNFAFSVQFSQAYVSPNWYQGGKRNLNVRGQLFYNVKLNPQFHPNLLFDNTFQYKVGINSAPDDSIHSYNISEDLFQANTTFGIKAHGNWYYSFTGQFKTQLLKSYKANDRRLVSSFMSPGELNAGIGMTYNKVNAKKTFSFDLSVAPISYNLKICTNDDIDVTQFDIKKGHHTKSSYGSTLDANLVWQIFSNITLRSRLFAFTDYDGVQADWENTIELRVNSFISTQIYTHLRFDDKTPYEKGDKWKKLQLKEVFSVGFSYQFKSF